MGAPVTSTAGGTHHHHPPEQQQHQEQILQNNPALKVNNPNSSESDENTKNIQSQQSSIEKTFTSLIQQYLALLHYENATFHAERMVALSPSPQAVYLLAMCHYRNHKPKKARSVLMAHNLNHRFHGRNKQQKERMGSGNSGDFDENDEGMTNATLENNITYLLAKCCLDIGLYHEAEDCLLKECRLGYISSSSKNRKSSKKDSASGATSNKNKNDQAANAGGMEEWIVTTSPCPIPNGAAGLYLLGCICQKTHRKEKAAGYFKMSLKLDPMMWASYEAICEMGAATSNPEEDPASTFGVMPQVLKSIPMIKGGYGPNIVKNTNSQEHQRREEGRIPIEDMMSYEHMSSSAGVGTANSPPTFSLAASPIMGTDIAEQQQLLSQYQQNHHNLTTPFSDNRGMGMAQPDDAIMENNNSNDNAFDSSQRGRYSLPPPGTATKKSHFPSTNLFASPDLTPIHPNTTTADDVGVSTTGIFNTSHANTMTPSPNQYNPTLFRAKQVAARLYYEPSPETTPPHLLGTKEHQHSSLKLTRGKRRKNRRRLDGLSSYWNASNGDDDGHFGGNDLSATMESEELMESSQINPNQFDKRVLFEQSRPNESRMTASAILEGSTLEDTGVGTPFQNILEQEDESKVDENFADTEDPHGGGEETGGVQYILELLCILGAAKRMMCSYQCQEAIELFSALPASQFNTGWVQHQVGRAYFEMADYPNAQRALERMQQLEPHRMSGLELLSTTLWHLKKEVDLANLAQRVVDFDRMAPESWCVVGNCFSLQKEHETALAFFRRSIQLDESFSYAHTLSGHEYVSNEDFDQAVSCFRNAIRVDDRTYTAWYGLGAIYFRQEKYDLAEYHFKRALKINPRSCVLHCHLGMTQHTNKKPYEALETLGGAFRIDPRNTQALYQRATIFMSIDKPQEALAELEKVRDAAPREASVHFAMGRVMKRLGRLDEAMRAFLTALDLDPKDNNLIKAAIDRLDEPEIDEDVSAF